MRIGTAVHASGNASASPLRTGGALAVNDTLEARNERKVAESAAQKRKIVQNFETVMAARIAADGKRDKTAEERDALAGAISNVIETHPGGLRGGGRRPRRRWPRLLRAPSRGWTPRR
jgi:hypothetical protein